MLRIILPGVPLWPIRLPNCISRVTILFLLVITIQLILTTSCRCSLEINSTTRILNVILADLKEVAQILVSEFLLEKRHPLLIISALWLIHILFRHVVILAIAVTRINNVRVGVHVDLLATRSGKSEVASRILLDLLVNLNLELNKFLFDFVVDVSLIFQEVVRIVLFSLIWIIDIQAVLPDVVNCTLNHPGLSHILAEGIVASDLTLSGDL